MVYSIMVNKRFIGSVGTSSEWFKSEDENTEDVKGAYMCKGKDNFENIKK